MTKIFNNHFVEYFIAEMWILLKSIIKLEDLDEATAESFIINNFFAPYADNVTIISAKNIQTGSLVLPRMIEYNYTVVAQIGSGLENDFYTWLDTQPDISDVATGGDPVLTEYIENNDLHRFIEYELTMPCPANETFDECATD